MGDKNITPTYDDLLSEVLDSVGLGALPSPSDGWVELVDLLASGLSRGCTDAQVRGAIDRSVRSGHYEKLVCGRRVFYRQVQRD